MGKLTATECAKQHGFSGDRLPWFGVFIAGDRTVTIAAEYKSPHAIDIALQGAMKMWPRETVCVRWWDEKGPCAGFVPNLCSSLYAVSI